MKWVTNTRQIQTPTSEPPIDEPPKGWAQRCINAVRRRLVPLSHTPQGVDEAIYLPMGFLIVLTVVVALHICVGILTIWLASEGAMWVGLAARFFPRNAECDTIQGSFLHVVSALETMPWFEELMKGRSGALLTFSQFVSRMLEGKTVVHKFVSAGNVLRSIESVLTHVGAFSFLVASFVTAVVMQRLLAKFPQLIRNARKGIYPFAPKIEMIEPYVAVHVMSFVLQQVIVEFLFILLAVVIDCIIVFELYLSLLFAIWLFVVPWAIVQGLSYVVKRHMVQDDTIIRPRMYSVWHFVALFFGIFRGVVGIIVRWLTNIALLTVCFTSVDISTFPSSLTSMDAAYVGFFSLVITEARANNPIFLTWIAMVLSDVELRHRCSRGEEHVAVDTFGSSVPHPGVQNLCRVYLRHQSGNPLSLSEAPTEADYILRKRTHTLQRWWLFVMLTRNPSLKKMRKHALHAAPTVATTATAASIAVAPTRTEAPTEKTNLLL